MKLPKTEEQIRRMLLLETIKAGGLAKWCEAHGFHRNTVGKVVNGYEPVWPRIAAVLGYEAVTVFRRKRKP